MNYRIVYFTKENGRSPVEEFINKLPARAKSRTFETFEIIKSFGLSAGMPYVKRIIGNEKLWEIRVKAGSCIYRYFFTMHKEKVILILSVFQKKTQKTPKKEIERAKRILKSIV